MVDIKKHYNLKILSILITLSLFFVDTIYPVSALRVPIDTDLKRPKEIIKNDEASGEEKVEGLLFMPKKNFKIGEPLDETLIKPTRSAEEIIALLKDAKKRGIELSI